MIWSVVGQRVYLVFSDGAHFELSRIRANVLEIIHRAEDGDERAQRHLRELMNHQYQIETRAVVLTGRGMKEEMETRDTVDMVLGDYFG